jgi:deoxyribose-phosphate aldolase
MKISSYIDATILNPGADSESFDYLFSDTIRFEFPAVCVPPFMVQKAKKVLSDSITKVATVVGFPMGCHTISTKILELRELIDLGADELDYVIHRGFLAANDFEQIEEELLAVVSICRDHLRVSKWIIEASELTGFQFEKCIEIANKISPDYVKTSTGVYGKADLAQVSKLRTSLNPNIKIKAAGGIGDLETAMKFIEAGSDRIGVSSYSKLV